MKKEEFIINYLTTLIALFLMPWTTAYLKNVSATESVLSYYRCKSDTQYHMNIALTNVQTREWLEYIFSCTTIAMNFYITIY